MRFCDRTLKAERESSLTFCKHSNWRRTSSELWLEKCDWHFSTSNLFKFNRMFLISPVYSKSNTFWGVSASQHYTKSLKSNLIMPYSYSGIFTKRNNNFMLMKASNEATYASSSLICTYITLSPSDSWTYHAVSLKAAGSLARLQRAEWKFAADDRSCEMKVHFTSSLLCLHLSRPPERSPNPPPSVYITQWIQPLWKRAGGRTTAILQP